MGSAIVRDAFVAQIRDDMARVHDAGVPEELADLRVTIDLLETVFVEGVRRLDTSRQFAAVGAVSTVNWLRS
jgi:hypothetical protein